MIQYDNIFLEPSRKLFALTGLTSLLILLLTWLNPFKMDQSVYQSMALQWVRFGRLPYLGSWDMNFPGIVFIHSFAILLFGNSDIGFHALDILVHLGSALMVYRLVERWTSPRVAFLAATVLCLLYSNGGDANTGQREGFAVFFVLAATTLLFYLRKRVVIKRDERNRSRKKELAVSIAIGICVGCACAIRPTYGLFAIILGIAVWNVQRQDSPARLAAYLFGVLLLTLAILLPFASKPGGINALYLATIRFNLDIYGSGSYRLPLIDAFSQKSEIFVDAVLGASLLAYFITRKYSSKGVVYPYRGFARFEQYLFVAYYIAARVSIWVMGKFFRHHYEFLLLLTSILIAMLIDRIILLIKSKRERAFVFSLILALLMLAIPWWVIRWLVQGLGQPGDTIEFVQSRLSAMNEDARPQNVALTKYIQARTLSTDRVEFCSEDAEFIWRSERQPATRFTMVFPLAMQLPHGGYTKYQLEWRKEFVDSLTIVRPNFIILALEHKRFMNFLTEPPNILMRRIPGFEILLAKSYTYDTTFCDFEIYRLTNAKPSP